MIGDRVFVKPHHTRIATTILDLCHSSVAAAIRGESVWVISIAGESGCGKSETAAEVTRLLRERDAPTLLLGQDDFYVFPPKTNRRMRERNPDQIGPAEVKLDYMDALIHATRQGVPRIWVPEVDFDVDRIDHVVREVAGTKAIVVEGTYCTQLEQVDTHVFIDRSYHQTREDRLARARDALDGFEEEILRIEHEIIRAQRERADLVVAADYSGVSQR
jgi:uridine kinase